MLVPAIGLVLKIPFTRERPWTNRIGQLLLLTRFLPTHNNDWNAGRNDPAVAGTGLKGCLDVIDGLLDMFDYEIGVSRFAVLQRFVQMLTASDI